MTTPAAQGLNTKIAISLIVGGSLLFIGLLFLLYANPAATFAAIDNVNIKVLLMALGFLVMTTIGTFFYWAYHIPTVRRLAATGWRATLFYTAIAGSFSIFGWPRISSFDLNNKTGLRTQFALSEASLEVWPNLAVCFSALIIMTLIYLLIGYLEVKTGQEL